MMRPFRWVINVSLQDFFIVFIAVALTMLACRVLPVFLLKGRQLPDTVVRALNFIPPAAFAALVANDLFDPAKVAGMDAWSWLAPLIAAAIVVVVGVRTKSMAWCIVAGVGALAVLTYGPALVL